MFLALPLFIRNRIAARMRAGSKAANSSKSMTIMDVNPQAVVSVMEKHGVQWLIHGHTHRPDVHSLIANGEPAHRVVLGARTPKAPWSKSRQRAWSRSRFRFNPSHHHSIFFEQYRQIVSILISPWSAYYLSHQGNTPYPR